MNTCIEEAKKARLKAYTPYSHFKVGAAIELHQGGFIHGANIENGSFGLTNCAERSAIYSALSQGYTSKDFKSITVIAHHKFPVSPCGACRQVMAELLPDDCIITLANLSGETKTFTKETLLPYYFKFEDTITDAS